MAEETTPNGTSQLVRDRLPILTKMAYGLGTALDMWGLWLYPSVAFAVFSIYLGVSPWLVGLAMTLIRFYDAFLTRLWAGYRDNVRIKIRPAAALHSVRRRFMRPGASHVVYGFADLVGQDVSRAIGCLLVHDCLLDDLHSPLQPLHRAV